MKIETDAQLVVKLWNSLESDRSEIANRIKETQELCGNFVEFQLSYIPREANEFCWGLILGTDKCTFETDAQLMVKLWNSLESDRSEIATAVKEIQELCGDFVEFRLSYFFFVK